ncbi:MAG: SIMPL domain-containing protein [Gemmatimonadaceae bacterium]
MKRALNAVTVLLLAPLSLHAQDNRAPFDQIPQISVVGRGEIKVSPDRATVQISVQTRAATAAAAATENAAKQQSVLAALKGLGLGDDQLSTVNYNVYPEQRYDQGKEPVIVAYNVTNTILVDVRKLAQVGPVIDAALAHGANMITSLQFYASNTEAARRSAIASAIEKARTDADAAARAARGSLGSLLEISIGSYSPPPPRPMMMSRAVSGVAQADTPINAGEETLAVEVNTRWRFLPAQ